MASSGPRYATSCVDDASIGVTAWTSPGSATSSDDSRADCATGVSSHYLKATGFGFSIPSNAVINGIVVECECSSLGTYKDNAVRIVKGGTICTSDRSNSGNWTGSDTFYSHGSSTDLWGESWTASDINSSGFGAALSVVYVSGIAHAYVDSFRITVYYTDQILIDGAVSAAASSSSALTTSISCQGSVGALSSATSSLTTSIRLSGAAESSSSTSLVTSIYLGSSAAASANAQAVLSTEISFSADLAAEAASYADLQTTIAFFADASATAQASAGLHTETSLGAAANVVSSAFAGLSTSIRFAGACQSASAALSILSIPIKFSANISAAAFSSAGIRTSIKFNGLSVSIASRSANLHTTIRMSAAISSTAATHGVLLARVARMLQQTGVIFLCEIDGYNPNSGVVESYRFSTGLGYDRGGLFYLPRIENPATFSREISAVGTFGKSAQSYGEMTLVNPDGALNWMCDRYFDGRTLVLKTGSPDDPYEDFQTVLIASVESVAVERSRVSVRLRDQSVVLDRPFSTVKYAGTNVLPDGIEGTPDDIKGQSKPRIFGRIALMEPKLVNTSKLIYQVNAGPVDAIVNVFDAGAYLSRGTDYVSQSDMEANSPAAGYYRAWPAGGCFRINSSPFGTISVSVAEKWSFSQISASGIIQRILQEVGVTEISASDFTSLSAKCSGPLGVVVGDEEPIPSILDRICQTIGGWWGFDYLGRFRIGRMDAPTGDPVSEITDDDCIEIERQPTDLLPAWQILQKSDINYAVQEKSRLAGVVTDARKAWIAEESRDQKAVDESIKSKHLLAADRKEEGLWASISQAQAEANRRMALYSGRRDTVTATLANPLGHYNTLDLGNVVMLRTSRLGYDTGRLMTVTGVKPDYQRSMVDVRLWG